MDITKFNEWWSTKSINRALVGKRRNIFSVIIRYLDKRQAILLKGLRRVGKTTLMYQLIDYLLQEKGINPYNILYFSFDENRGSLEDILEEYSHLVLKKTFTQQKEKLYIFLDEIQKLKGWADALKIFYDIYPNIKFIISGSAALGLLKDSRESLAGRVLDFDIEPLDFKEFLLFREVSIDYERIDIYKDLLQSNFNQFLKTSGFIEILNEDDEVIKKYFTQSILERVIFRDIPEIFSVKEPHLLFTIIKILAANPGMLVDFQNLSNDLNRDKRTISTYFEYLKYSLLVNPLYNFSRNMLTSEKKLKKYYLSHSAFCHAISNIEKFKLIPNMVENCMVSKEKAKFFYRTPDRREVDIIKIDGNKLTPIEIKYTSSIQNSEISGIKSFMKKYKVKDGIIISKDLEDEIYFSYGRVKIIPVWKYMLL